MEEISNLVSIFPDPLVLSKSNNSNNYESYLNLSNLTNNYVIFKIKCNQSKLYTIKPGVGFIPPKETVNVAIKRFDKEENLQDNKLLLKFHTINKVINDNAEAKEAYNTKLYNKDSKQEQKISIILKEKETEEENKKTMESMISSNYETVIENIGDNYDKGIEEYSNINKNLKNEINTINKKNKDLKDLIEIIKTQEKLKQDKDRAMKDERNAYKYSGNNNINIIVVLIILFGLLIGANIANIYNKIFYKKHIPIQDMK